MANTTANTTGKKLFGKVITKVAGTTFEGRQGKLWNLRKAQNEGKKCYLMLRRNLNNSHDKNAIEVLAHIDGEDVKNPTFRIGYVPASISCWLAPRMDSGFIVRAYAEEKDKPFVHGNKGVNLGVTMKVVYELGANEVAVAEAEAEA